MKTKIILVHAPLVGVATWRWVADELAARRFDVVAPALHMHASSPTAEGFAAAIREAIDRDDVVLVGHSGAGILLPSAARGCVAKTIRYVFVDAGLPPLAGAVELASTAFRASLEDRANGSPLLPAWHTRWGSPGWAWLVRDPARRQFLERDMPRLALSYYDSPLAVPDGWADNAHIGYLLLSDVYRPSAGIAKAYGWPIEECPGTHLEMVNQPAQIAESIVRLAGI